MGSDFISLISSSVISIYLGTEAAYPLKIQDTQEMKVESYYIVGWSNFDKYFINLIFYMHCWFYYKPILLSASHFRMEISFIHR